MEPGDTFLTDESHLWIVLTEAGLDGTVVCVNLTSRRFDSDDTTICNVGEHRYIRNETVVAYGFARTFPSCAITRALDDPGNPLRRHDTCSAEFLSKVRDGILKSEFTPNGIKSKFRASAAD